VTGLPGELRDGFTVAELATGIRRHYRGDAVLAFRDLPLELPEGRHGYLRVGVGERTGARGWSACSVRRWRTCGRCGSARTGWQWSPRTAGY